MKLNIAAGQQPIPGFKGIDIAEGADIVHDLNVFPWPIKSNTVTEAVCSHYAEHIPHYRPEFNGVDGWWLFFDELSRIMKRNATATFTHPYVWNDRAFWDPTHVRFIHEMAYYYLDKQWRTSQGLDHYPVKCDFEVVTISAGLSDEMMAKNDQAQAYARMHYKNSVGDLTVIIRKR